MGSPLGPVFENAFLMPIDEILSEEKNSFYARYGDDILIASSEPAQVTKMSNRLDEELKRRNLNVKSSKSKNCVFGLDPEAHSVDSFANTSSIEYLGADIFSSGEVFLSQRKVRQLKRLFHNAARRAFFSNRKYKLTTSERVEIIIENLNSIFEEPQLIPHFSILMNPRVSHSKTKKLDRWIAKQALKFVFGSSHDRVFRHYSYKRLREQGLYTLCNLRHLRVRKKSKHAREFNNSLD